MKGVLKFLNLENLSEHLSGYIEDRIELLKIELQEEGAALGTKLLLLVGVIVFGMCCLLFISLALAILLNGVFEHPFVGYFIIAAAYLVLTLIVFSLRENDGIKRMLYKVLNKSSDKAE